MCSVSEDSVRKPIEHWLQKKAWFPSRMEKLTLIVAATTVTGNDDTVLNTM